MREIGEVVTHTPMNCKQMSQWEQGYRIVQYMKMVCHSDWLIIELTTTDVLIVGLRKRSTASRVRLHSTTWVAGRISSWRLLNRPRMVSRRLALGTLRTVLITHELKVRWIRSGSKLCRTKLSLSCLGLGRHFSENGEWVYIGESRAHHPSQCVIGALSANTKSTEYSSLDIYICTAPFAVN